MAKGRFREYDADQFAVDFWRYFTSQVSTTSKGHVLRLNAGRNNALWLIDTDGEKRRITVTVVSWRDAMSLVAPVEELKPVEARAIVESLRRGTVPIDHVPYFTVGRERWLSIIEDDLANYIAAGGAKVRFLSGDYGDGKTHFLSVIQHLVQQEKFAVSFVVLTREVPMHKFELVYQEIVSRLVTRPGTTGLRVLLAHWLETLQPQLGDPDEATRTARLQEIAETVKSLEGMDINFAQGLISLVQQRYRAARRGRHVRGAGRPPRDCSTNGSKAARLSKSELRPFQIFESLNKTQQQTAVTVAHRLPAPPGVSGTHSPARRAGDGDGCSPPRCAMPPMKMCACSSTMPNRRTICTSSSPSSRMSSWPKKALNPTMPCGVGCVPWVRVGA